jgi:hypothetical protein
MANVLFLAMIFSLVSFAAYVPTSEAQTYTITGNVLDASGNTGLPGVVITVKDANNVASQATTDASGNYTIINLAAGDYTLTDVTKTGYEWISAPPLPVTLSAEAQTAAIETIYMRPATGPEPYVLNLKLNWNLISLPHQPDNTAIATVLTEIANHYVISWSYPNKVWKYYDPSDAEGSTFNTMEAGKAYWVKTDGAYALTVAGTTASPTVELLQGWNFVGYNKDTATPIGTALAGILGKYTIVWAYVENSQNPTQNQWKYYDPADAEGSTLLQMSPGYGYWIKTTQVVTLTYP